MLTPVRPGPRRAPAPTAASSFPTVPGYEILTELGRGGMGIVYLALQRSLNRHVALKMIVHERHADPSLRVRFRTEADAIARLQHPHIVHIYEIGEHDGRLFLALEYVPGDNLARQAGGAAWSEHEAARLVEALSRAVAYTHSRGILHRDLKPTNILMMPEGTPKITDFGLAKLLDQDGVTRTETLIGTPNYMSPEQAAGDTQKIGVASDIYALGAILYELLTGRAPFAGVGALDTLEQVRSREPARPSRVRRSLSRDLETICLKCLEKEPRNRYATAAALADDLHRFVAGDPIEARPVAAWRRLWRTARRRPVLLGSLTGVAALVCLVLTLGWHVHETAQLARLRDAERHQKFVQRRNDAFVYGLLAPDDSAFFLGTDPAANAGAADVAAEEALRLAGVQEGALTVAPDFAAPHRYEAAADCQALLLLRASDRAQRPLPGETNNDRCRAALGMLEAVEPLTGQTRSYHHRRADLLDRLSDHAAAQEEREHAGALPPAGALDHFLSGEEHYRRGEWHEAMHSFDRALAAQPGHFWAQFLLAICHLKQQQWDAAKAGLNACLAQQPDFVWAYLFRSFANEKSQARKEAAADLETALQLHPNDDARYVLLLARGIYSFREAEWQRAAADFRAAMALRPSQYNAYLNLAQVYLAQKQFDQADEQFRTALQLEPPKQVVIAHHIECGRAFLRDQRYDEALRACDAALALSAVQPPAHEVRARVLLAVSRFHEAEHAFDDYLRAGGEENADIFAGRGLARMKLAKYADAAEDYGRALELRPTAELFQHRGWAHFFADAWKLAVRDFSKAIELNPDDGDAHTGRGLMRVMLGDYREAVADADAALRCGLRTPEMMHNIACLFAQAAARAAADSVGADQPLGVAEYRRRACQAVQQTLAMLPADERRAFWRHKIVPDAALDPIRTDAEFQQLAAMYDNGP